MSVHPIRQILFLALALAGIEFTQAQEGASASAVYRMTSFGSAPLKITTYANSPGGESVRVAQRHVTNPVKAKLRDDTFLDFWAEGAGAEDPPAFSLRIPAGNRNDLLVILMTSKEGMKPVLVDLKAINLRGGGQYVYNLLPVAVAVQCGEDAKPVTIKPGSKRSIAPPSADKVIQSLYYSNSDGKPVKFSSSLYFRDEQTRQIVFCYAEKGAKRPKVTPICIYDRKKPAGS